MSKPSRRRNLASSSPKPVVTGAYGGRLETMLTPCMMATRPWASVIQRPFWDSGPVGAATAGAAQTAATNATTAHSRLLRLTAPT